VTDNVTNKQQQVAQPALRIGTLSLAPGSAVPGDPGLWTLVFKSRKGGFDFLGQATLCHRMREMRLEVFNDNYYAHFSHSRREVRAALEKKLLALLANGAALPEPWGEAVKALRRGPPPAVALPQGGEGEIDLDEIFRRLNEEYFAGGVVARVIWGRDAGNHNKSGFRFGSYDDGKKLIRVHPRLKQGFVPREVVELTVYHEMCHQWVPAIRKNGAWRSHHAGFRKKEKEYRHYQAARDWEKKHWRKLLKPVARS